MTVDVYRRHELPNYWEWKKLGDICSVTDRDHRTPKYIENGIPLISPRDFTENGIDLSRLKSVDKNEHVAFVKKCNPAKGDILYSRIGTIGEARLQNFDFDFVALHSIALIKPTLEGLDPKYVLYLLQTPDVRSQAKHNIKSVGTPDLGLKRINNFDVPLAPTGEQQRIVAEIEKQFSRLDEAVTNLKRVKANLKRYKAAVLKAAVEGVLVPIKSRQTKKLGEVAQLVTKGSSPNWQGFTYTDSGVVFVRSQNVGWGNLDLSDVAHLPSAFNEKERKSVLRTGDVLLNIVGASIGRAAIATPEIDGGNVNQAVAVIRLNQELMLPKYLMINLLSPGTQTAIHAEKVDVARANVSLSDIKDFSILFPSLAEQGTMVAEVERHLSVIEQLAAAVNANLTRAGRLRQSVLAKSFSGGLTKFQ